MSKIDLSVGAIVGLGIFIVGAVVPSLAMGLIAFGIVLCLAKIK